MWESKFVPDINPETTLEEMVGRAATLKKLAEGKFGTFQKDIQEMVDKTRGSRRKHGEREKKRSRELHSHI